MALSDIVEPFVWGAGGARKTPEQIARDREVAAALMQQGLDFSPVASPWQGLARVADAAVGAYKNYRSDQADKTNATTNQSLIQGLLGDGSEQFPAAPGAPTASDYADTRVKTAFGDNADEIKQGLVARGMAPQIADAFVMNFQDESGLNPGINEKAPLVAGSRGGFGLAQWTGPRRRALEAFAADRGTSPSDTGTQLDFLMSELNGPEKAAWAKIQGADTTGGAAAAIVNNFLRPAESHRAARESRYLANADPVQVASTDPMALIGDYTPYAPKTETERASRRAAMQPVMDQIVNSTDAAPALPAPTIIQDMPVAGTSAPSPQVAQALTGQDLSRIPVTAGGNAGVYQPGQGGSMQAIVQALSSPYADDRTKQIAGMLLGNQLQQQQQASDPLRQLEMDYKRAQIAAMQNPVAKPTDDMREYDFAKSQGYDGSFLDFQLAQKKAGATTISDIGNTKGETEYDKTLGKNLADKTVAIIDAGQQAPNKLATYQQLSAMLPNVYTGAGGDSVLAAKRVAKSLGMDVGDVSDAEFIQAMGNQMALELRNPAGGAGMPGAMSDKDREFLASMSPGLSKTPQGNQKLLEYRMAVEKRNVQVAQRASDYMNTHGGRLDNGFFSELSQWSAQNPLFPEQSEKPRSTVIDGYTIEEVQ